MWMPLSDLNRPVRTLAANLFGLLCACAMVPTASAQLVEVEPELIDQQPFDLITLTEQEGGEQVKVLPIPFPGRQVPSNPSEGDKIEVVLVKYPERRYEVAWRDIARVDLFEQMIYDEALQKMEEKDFVTAFQNLSFLMKNYSQMPRLESLRQEFIFKSAIDRFSRGELRQTLSALEELRESAPGYRASDVTTALSRVATRLIRDYQEGGKLGSAQALLDRLRDKYGPTMAVVQEWENRLKNMALEKKGQAERLMEQERYREARDAAMEMLSIFPELQEGKELLEEIGRQHPMVRVGVMQRGGDLDPSSLVDWPARRAGSLAYRSLFQFLETGAEGGRYGFALGTYRMTDDRLQLVLTIDPNIQDSLNAFGLTQELLQRANPTHESYDPSWAAIFKSVEARSADQVIVELRRPNVLPHALLQWVLPDKPDQPGALPGQYAVSHNDASELAMQLREGQPRTGQPVEIIEVFYEDPKEAVNDLLRGDIDVIDQLYPADAKRLASIPKLSVGSYALPSTHMLIPVSDHAYLANSKFRRALLYATDREGMLTGELLNSNSGADGKLISGPFPIGEGETDPLAYAYDPDVEPTDYSPPLAKLLVVMTTRDLAEAAKKSGEPAPELEPLVIGCPDYEFARVAVEGMIQQWKNVDIDAQIKIIGNQPLDEVDDCDLLYVVTSMWEPATDIERLLGGDGIATSDNPFIVQGLTRLRHARNWREIRDAMQDLHQLVDYHLPVLPLWQVTDRFVVSNYVEGLEDLPVSLYQNVINWRVNLNLRTARR